VTASQTVHRDERLSLEGRARLSIFLGSRGILVASNNNRSAEGRARVGSSRVAVASSRGSCFLVRG